ncbi:MAG: zf-HC2 domain-containing protein [Proteobacteria bacterium]|nr:zf-HC2 domain-containing protein [Pseudomonadota bacterium]
MECSETRELLDAWLDRELSPELAEGIEQHLESCPDCAEESASLGRLAASLEAMPPIQAPTRLAGQTLKAFRRELNRPGLRDWWRGLSLAMRGAACGAALAGMVFGIVIGSTLASSLDGSSAVSYIQFLYDTGGILP